ncbi:MAG: hypothetical protein KOO60_07345 [Gemmatimonadales bacterium]|nr:hypothetical protein [Gemmatimonadales bacterium]
MTRKENAEQSYKGESGRCCANCTWKRFVPPAYPDGYGQYGDEWECRLMETDVAADGCCAEFEHDGIVEAENETESKMP